MSAVLQNRVVITGLGAITPLGNTVADYWQGLLAGRSDVGHITHFDAAQHACQIGAEVKGFDPTAYMSTKEAKRASRFSHHSHRGKRPKFLPGDRLCCGCSLMLLVKPCG